MCVPSRSQTPASQHLKLIKRKSSQQRRRNLKPILTFKGGLHKSFASRLPLPPTFLEYPTKYCIMECWFCGDTVLTSGEYVQFYRWHYVWAATTGQMFASGKEKFFSLESLKLFRCGGKSGDTSSFPHLESWSKHMNPPNTVCVSPGRSENIKNKKHLS